MQASELHTGNVASSGNSGPAPFTEAELRVLLVRHQAETWPLDSLVTLCLSIQAGASCGAIGKVLGITKNAVVGKSHRLMDAGLLPRKANPFTWAPDDPRRSANPRVNRPLPVVVGGTLPPLASVLLQNGQPASGRSGPRPRADRSSHAYSALDMEVFRSMRAEGKTDAEIGARLGKSEEAVRIKARRIGLPGRRSPRLPALRSATPARAARPPAPSATPRQAPEFPASQPKQSEPPPKRYLPPPVQGRVGSCCWPLGDPGTPTFRFCDDPSAPGRPYCMEHVKGAFLKIPNRQKSHYDGYARPAASR